MKFPWVAKHLVFVRRFAAFFGLLMAAPAFALTAIPYPNPEPPPRLGLQIDVTWRDLEEGVVYVGIENALSCLRTDCASAKVRLGLIQPFKLERIPLEPGVSGSIPLNELNPLLRLELVGTSAPFNDPRWTLTAGAVLTGPLSDLQKGMPSLGFQARAGYDINKPLGDGKVRLLAGFNAGYIPDAGNSETSIAIARIEGVAAIIGFTTQFSTQDESASKIVLYDMEVQEMFLTLRSCVPEPNTWATMIAGFGLVGWRARRTLSRAGIA